jgi:hypothetical protein
VGAEDPTHLGGMVTFTVWVLVPRLHAELSLAGADGRRACAVAAQRRGHREGLHSGLSPESSFTYAKRDNTVVTRREKCPDLSPQAPWPACPAPCKILPVESFGNVTGGLPFSEHSLRVSPAKHEASDSNKVLSTHF